MDPTNVNLLFSLGILVSAWISGFFFGVAWQRKRLKALLDAAIMSKKEVAEQQDQPQPPFLCKTTWYDPRAAQHHLCILSSVTHLEHVCACGSKTPALKVVPDGST